MKAHDWRLVGDEEIEKSRADLRRELFDLRFQAATDSLENPARIQLIRRDLARIETVLNERRRAAAAGASEGPTGVVTAE